jgi:hypothetical protein
MRRLDLADVIGLVGLVAFAAGLAWLHPAYALIGVGIVAIIVAWRTA